MRNTRTFNAYCSGGGAGNVVAAKQAEYLKFNEFGQNWPFMLTLRVPIKNSDRLLLQGLEDYFALLEDQLHLHLKRRSERVLRSVYLHKVDDTYHAHVFSKYPKGFSDWQKPIWEAELLQCWYKTPAVQRQDPDNIESHKSLYNFRRRVTVKKGWGAYGIKNNSGNQAWIEDLSRLHISMGKAIRKGKILYEALEGRKTK